MSIGHRAPFEDAIPFFFNDIKGAEGSLSLLFGKSMSAFLNRQNVDCKSNSIYVGSILTLPVACANTHAGQVEDILLVLD
jgi:hypothetical protein